MDLIPIDKKRVGADFFVFKDSLFTPDKLSLKWDNDSRNFKFYLREDTSWTMIRDRKYKRGQGIEIYYDDTQAQQNIYSVEVYINGVPTFNFGGLATIYIRGNRMLVYQHGVDLGMDHGTLSLLNLRNRRTEDVWHIEITEENKRCVYWPIFLENDVALLRFDRTLYLDGIITKMYVIMEKVFGKDLDHPFLTLKLFRNIGDPHKNASVQCEDDRVIDVSFADEVVAYPCTELLQYRSTFLNDAIQDGEIDIHIPIMTRQEFENLRFQEIEYTPKEIFHLTYLDSDFLREYLLYEVNKVETHIYKKSCHIVMTTRYE